MELRALTILKDADLSALSGKKVRQQIEEKLDIDLTSRRKEVDELVMECLQDKKGKSKGKKNGSAHDKSDDEEDEDEEDEEEEDEEEEEKPKRAAKKPAPKRKKGSSDESDDASEDDPDDDYSPKKKSKPGKKAPKKAGRKAAKDSDSESGSDWGKSKKKPVGTKAKKSGGGKGGGGGYTKALKLSPELSELMGEEEMPRHEVVKRVWALIKEKNLYDPKNKQFAICNDELFKVFGVKRFRTFGMMKLLKDHFVS